MSGGIWKALEKKTAYHPSTVQPQTYPWTGAGAWPRCRLEGPCFSLTTHLPYSQPAG